MVWELFGPLILVVAVAAGEPEVVTTRVKPSTPPAAGQRYYIVELKILEISPDGEQTVIAEPVLQTAGAAAGVTVEGDTGRRFEFHFSAAEAGAPAPLPVTLTPSPGDAQPIASSNATGNTNSLDRKISIKAVQQPRREVLRAVAQQAGLNVAMEPNLASSAVQQLSAPISVELNNASLGEALKQLVDPLKLEYAVRHDLVLLGFQSSVEDQTPLPSPIPRPVDNDWHVRVYGVADLVTISPKSGQRDYQTLVENLRQRVLKDSWQEAGGQANIRVFDSTASLVIRQTTAGHAEVTRYLESLKAPQP